LLGGQFWETFIPSYEIAVGSVIVIFGFIGILNVLADSGNRKNVDFALCIIILVKIDSNGFIFVGYVVNFALDCGFSIITVVGVSGFYPCCGYGSTSSL